MGTKTHVSEHTFHGVVLQGTAITKSSPRIKGIQTVTTEERIAHLTAWKIILRTLAIEMERVLQMPDNGMQSDLNWILLQCNDAVDELDGMAKCEEDDLCPQCVSTAKLP